MPQFRDIPAPEDPVRVRLDLSEAQAVQLRTLGARQGLALAAICRIAMGMLARGETVTQEAVLAEAERIRDATKAAQPAPEPPPPPRPRGRPKKAPQPPQEPSAGAGEATAGQEKADAPAGKGKARKRKGG